MVMTPQDFSSVLDRLIAVNGQNVLLNLRAVDISTLDPTLLLEKGLSQISQVTDDPYSLVILPANDISIPLYQMSSFYSKLPRQVRKNLKRLYILEPSWSLRMYFNVLIFMASPKFFRKIKWVDDRFIAPYFYTFGVDLAVVMTDQLILPKLVQDSIAVISKNIETVGLFRVTPSIKLLAKVKEAYDNGNPGELGLLVLDDVHLACSLLKMFVRELPEPVFVDDLYMELKQSLDCTESDLTLTIQDTILHRLRKPEFLLFKSIMDLLHKIHCKSDVNKMDSKNLSLVWSPNFIKTPKDDYDHIKHNIVLKGLSFLLRYCVENYDVLF